MASTQAEQSKRQSAQPPPDMNMPTAQSKRHSSPARTAPGAQSSELNGVRGVGSVHWLELGPVHSRQAAWHGWHWLAPSRCLPRGQEGRQAPSLKRGRMLGGQAEEAQEWDTQLVQALLPGPEQVAHVSEQATHCRCRLE